MWIRFANRLMMGTEFDFSSPFFVVVPNTFSKIGEKYRRRNYKQ